MISTETNTILRLLILLLCLAYTTHGVPLPPARTIPTIDIDGTGLSTTKKPKSRETTEKIGTCVETGDICTDEDSAARCAGTSFAFCLKGFWVVLPCEEDQACHVSETSVGCQYRSMSFEPEICLPITSGYNEPSPSPSCLPETDTGGVYSPANKGTTEERRTSLQATSCVIGDGTTTTTTTTTTAPVGISPNPYGNTNLQRRQYDVPPSPTQKPPPEPLPPAPGPFTISGLFETDKADVTFNLLWYTEPYFAVEVVVRITRILTGGWEFSMGYPSTQRVLRVEGAVFKEQTDEEGLQSTVVVCSGAAAITSLLENERERNLLDKYPASFRFAFLAQAVVDTGMTLNPKDVAVTINDPVAPHTSQNMLLPRSRLGVSVNYDYNSRIVNRTIYPPSKMDPSSLKKTSVVPYLRSLFVGLGIGAGICVLAFAIWITIRVRKFMYGSKSEMSAGLPTAGLIMGFMKGRKSGLGAAAGDDMDDNYVKENRNFVDYLQADEGKDDNEKQRRREFNSDSEGEESSDERDGGKEERGLKNDARKKRIETDLDADNQTSDSHHGIEYSRRWLDEDDEDLDRKLHVLRCSGGYRKDLDSITEDDFEKNGN